MKGVQAPCPACGGPVRFKISSSLVTVCEFCHSVVARGDRKLEDLGKVAAIVETNSPLHLGLKGKYGGKSFELVGRAQYAHAAGGSWDEWYAAFSNGKWGWLAEAQGRFYLTFERKPSEESKLPSLSDLHAGEKFTFPGIGEFTVGEVGEAKTHAAAGEIPYEFTPNASHRFADLYGKDSTFATFDYSDADPKLYLGKEVSLHDLGVGDRVVAPDQEPKQISALHLNCPQCAGPLTLHAPDQTQRVCCPNCSSLLDVNQGNLKFLQSLDFGKMNPLIPIGTTGTLFDVEYTLIGMLRRSVTEEGTDYFWSEYLLYNPREGFRWLVFNDGHWSFVRPVSPGEVNVAHDSATYQGRKFKIFQRGLASVRYVLGECYWKVAVGERAFASDFIAPPDMLSIETSVPAEPDPDGPPPQSSSSEASEVNMSLGTYVTRDVVEKAFRVDELPSTWKIAPNQPFPVDSRMWAWWAAFIAVLIGLDAAFSNGIIKEGVDQFFFFVSLVMMSVIPGGTLIFKLFFESSRWKDSPFNPYSSGSSDDDD